MLARLHHTNVLEQPASLGDPSRGNSKSAEQKKLRRPCAGSAETHLDAWSAEPPGPDLDYPLYQKQQRSTSPQIVTLLVTLVSYTRPRYAYWANRYGTFGLHRLRQGYKRRPVPVTHLLFFGRREAC